MGSFSLTHWLVVLLVVLILFGAGKLPRLMGDFAKGIKNFKTNLKDDEASETALAGSRPAAKIDRRRAARPQSCSVGAGRSSFAACCSRLSSPRAGA